MFNKMMLIYLLLLTANTGVAQKTVILDTEVLKDKMKGGWAGQTIGVTYGAPVEFRYQGSMINDYQKLDWYDGLIKKSMLESPGIYDDLYMDISFMEVFEKEGLQAPVASHAAAYANAGYMLWHANQAARYNILHGITAPQSGHWLHNPHADCIDFQIEADFAGLLSPGMPIAAGKLADSIGHIMNYGDGWYGGVYVSTMYSLAYLSGDIQYIVKEALKSIPANTTFYACITDVINWYKQFPNDWKRNWFEIQKKWTDDIGCPDGVFSAFNIDAKVNAAYVVLGLLYGKGDFGKTIDIATRAGQDADCNPSTAAGILGTAIGYNRIPAYWKMGLKEAEGIDFKYTHTSLTKVYDITYTLALENIKRNGGGMVNDKVMIAAQPVKAVKREQSFLELQPDYKKWLGVEMKGEYNFEFTGTAFVITGEYKPVSGSVFDEGLSRSAKLEIYTDGNLTETVDLPMSFTLRRTEIAWNYQLPQGHHRVQLKFGNPDKESILFLGNLITYSGKK